MKDDIRALRKLMLATTRIDGAYYFFSRKLGIKENVLSLLYALADGEPHSQKQIGEDWLIPKTTINTNVKELVKAGYVRLCAAQRPREKTVCLTERGKAYTDRIMRCVYESEQEAIEKTLERFPPEFVDAIDFFADRLCEAFQKRLPEQKIPPERKPL